MTEQPCASCGRPITITRRNPNRRYCSPRCRVADWHARNDRAATVTDAVHDVLNDVNDVPNAVPPGNDVPNAVPPGNDVPTPPNGVPIANGVQRCPH